MPTAAPITLSEGDPAPDFCSPDQSGNTVQLSSLRGKPVLLFFYPKDNTPGCTKEACAFRDQFDAFQKRGVQVLGISTDSVKSHQKFASKFDLPFPLIADTEKAIVQAYGVWGEKKFMGRTYDGTFRASFLIDAKGKIQKIWPQVKPEPHPAEVLELLK